MTKLVVFPLDHVHSFSVQRSVPSADIDTPLAGTSGGQLLCSSWSPTGRGHRGHHFDGSGS